MPLVVSPYRHYDSDQRALHILVANMRFVGISQSPLISSLSVKESELHVYDENYECHFVSCAASCELSLEKVQFIYVLLSVV